ncbi:MAG: hypothetical protein AB4063_01515 [Crocosphaera sp.]
MLFNSYEFIFLFLPIVLLGFFTLSLFKNCVLSIAWLVAASLFFYGYWNTKYLLLIVGSIVFNYFLGNLINKEIKNSKPDFCENRLAATANNQTNVFCSQP